ncbi:MAG: S8 family serine peptidase [Faecalibacterium prausnitzii]
MKKNSRSVRTHKRPRKSSRGWIIALIGVVLLFLGIILIFLMVGSSSVETSMPAASVVNVEKDIPETDMGDLVYHEPAAENVVMQGGFGYVNNELLITLDSSESLPQLKEYLAGIGGEVVGEIPLTADYQIMLPGTYTEEELETIIEQVKSLPYVERSSLNYAFELEDDSEQYYPDDPKWDNWKSTGGNNWNMKAIDAPGAWAYRNQMGPVNVGVIDGMFYTYHEDLKNVFQEMPLGNVTDMGEERYNGGGNWTDQDHATHVSGIIGAEFNNRKGVCGVAPNVKLYGVDAHSNIVMKYSNDGTSYVSDSYWMQIAMVYLVGEKHCQVINLSQEQGYFATKTMDDWNKNMASFIKRLHDKSKNEFVICKAAGNDAKDARKGILSGIEDSEVESMIIVVGSAAVSGKHSYFGCKHDGYRVASHSNRGSRVDVLAPGGDNESTKFPDAQIYSTIPGGYRYLYGTSMAAPHVAGVAAMIFGIDPTFTAEEVKDIIVSTATGSYENGIGNKKCSRGLLNARLAVEEAIRRRDKKASSPDESAGKHRYKIYYDTLTWEEAKAACEAKGGHLATITSEKEQYLLELSNDKNQNLWIGGYKNADGQWCWVTGEPWEYENWGDGEPNNSSNVVADENRVAMWPEKWNDLANGNIYEQNGYICEWEATNDEGTVEEDGYAGHVYEFYTLPESEWESGPITWEQAERRCEWKGGHLAVIESQAENDYLYAAMKQKGYENACFGYSDKETEGSWKWVNGVQSAYTNWHSGEPNHQNGNEHYAMFYQKFDDGTWNDGNGLIDADCAYICEWDDPADKQPSGDTFTERQLKIIAKDLGVPENLDVQIKQYPKTYWKAAGLWDIYVEVLLDGKVIASGSFDVETGEMGRNLYIYSPNQ